MTSPVTVAHLGDDRFVIDVRGHKLEVDQPVGAGGTDLAPTPTELFIASLASCVAYYARRYLVRHGLPTDDLEVEADYSFGSHPARVTKVNLRLAVSAVVPPERHEALLAMAAHCTVHNTLTHPPEVTINLHSVDQLQA